MSAHISLAASCFIFPYFIVEGRRRREEIRSFPGVFRFSVDTMLGDLEALLRLGVRKIILFGVPDARQKNDEASAAYEEGNLVARAAGAVKKAFPHVTVMTDVCLCAYTRHGHCGILKKGKGSADKRATLEALAAMAMTHAAAGADWVAPSAMAKQQVAALREALDKGGYRRTEIMGYSAKFASNFYGPFRDAASCSPQFGDRRAYQLDYTKTDTAMALDEIAADINEGADMVMVKPALCYLDIIREAKRAFSKPLAAYNVSGEYAMVKSGARLGLWDEKKAVVEILCAIKRAGADFIISYHAKEAAGWLKESSGA